MALGREGIATRRLRLGGAFAAATQRIKLRPELLGYGAMGV